MLNNRECQHKSKREGATNKGGEGGGGEKMQANPAYLSIEISYKSQERKYINVTS